MEARAAGSSSAPLVAELMAICLRPAKPASLKKSEISKEERNDHAATSKSNDPSCVSTGAKHCEHGGCRNRGGRGLGATLAVCRQRTYAIDPARSCSWTPFQANPILLYSIHLAGHSTEGSWDVIHKANILGHQHTFEPTWRQSPQGPNQNKMTTTSCAGPLRGRVSTDRIRRR